MHIQVHMQLPAVRAQTKTSKNKKQKLVKRAGIIVFLLKIKNRLRTIEVGNR